MSVKKISSGYSPHTQSTHTSTRQAAVFACARCSAHCADTRCPAAVGKFAVPQAAPSVPPLPLPRPAYSRVALVSTQTPEGGEPNTHHQHTFQKRKRADPYNRQTKTANPAYCRIAKNSIPAVFLQKVIHRLDQKVLDRTPVKPVLQGI